MVVQKQCRLATRSRSNLRSQRAVISGTFARLPEPTSFRKWIFHWVIFARATCNSVKMAKTFGHRNIICFAGSDLTERISFASGYRVKKSGKRGIDELLTDGKLIDCFVKDENHTKFLLSFIDTNISLRLRRFNFLNNLVDIFNGIP